MGHQRGLGLVGVIFVGAVLALLAIVAMKVFPAYMEYFAIRKNVSALARSDEARASNPAELRKLFDRRADVEDIRSIRGRDLDITREQDGAMIAFAYDRRIHLFDNVDLCVTFEGRASGGKPGAVR